MRPPLAPPVWLTPAVFAALPAVLCVRELRYRVTQAGFRTQTVTLVTTVLDVDLYPADALAALYGMRWQVETNLRLLTHTMGMEVLHCQRLLGVLKELTVLALVYTLVRVVMLAAREAARRRPRADQLPRCPAMAQRRASGGTFVPLGRQSILPGSRRAVRRQTSAQTLSAPDEATSRSS